MKYLYLLLLVSSISNAGGETTQIPDYSKIHKPYLAITCIDAKNQHEMDACSKKSLSMVVDRMERILEALKKNYKTSEPDLLTALEKSQISWENYKESSCKLETYYSRNGSGFNSIWNGCLETKVNERISYLSWIIENP